ncbi:hypothetical protein NNJEOMEG_01587 [Fundidesulfovibrio magnetotacticus]|uniref:Sulfotransferase domain-containing protein n=1 Tax=Fundidesulfovibrio magnetotacticus TaxID=2730080 RepID=A0A6V8LM43_9BACT|nr:sulfotransferase domain-containing protein [Fundidesulfovibrio magnetotacticus]GFK93753.1 hypothetical protein NNJEOMEG_01587 [Fundidesulfovibrio magnetotacticus]
MHDPEMAAQEVWAYFKRLNKGLTNSGRKVNLIGVGAGRCGTSMIQLLFENSRDIYATPVKEVNYFGVMEEKHHPRGWSRRDYERIFLDADSEKYVCEISPVYLTQPGSAESILQYNQDIKIIITLREPLSRSISLYKHLYREHGNNSIEKYFTEGLSQVKLNAVRETDWLSPGKNILQSQYADAIAKFLKLFPRENICILLYEDLRYDSAHWINTLESFIGLDLDSSFLSCNVNASEDVPLDLTPECANKLLSHFLPDVIRTSEILGIDLKTKWYSHTEQTPQRSASLIMPEPDNPQRPTRE